MILYIFIYFINIKKFILKKVLICGATGFIGKNVILDYQKKNYEIHAVRYNRPKYDSPKNVTWHRADLRNPNMVDKLQRT